MCYVDYPKTRLFLSAGEPYSLFAIVFWGMFLCFCLTSDGNHNTNKCQPFLQEVQKWPTFLKWLTEGMEPSHLQKWTTILKRIGQYPETNQRLLKAGSHFRKCLSCMVHPRATRKRSLANSSNVLWDRGKKRQAIRTQWRLFRSPKVS